LTSGAGYAKELTTGADFSMDGVDLVGDFWEGSSVARGGKIGFTAGRAAARIPVTVYGLNGSRIGTYDSRELLQRRREGMPRGVYIVKDAAKVRLRGAF
jgi:hypothetical protein